MLHKNLTLLPNMSGKVSFEGEPVKAIGYYSNSTNKRLNTISIHTLSFTGRIYIYGTLKIEPEKESDWAVIPIGCLGEEFIEFNHYGNVHAIRENTYVNIKGGYTWLKAKMDRDYLNCIKTPVPIDYRQPHRVGAENVGDHVTFNNKVEKVIPEPSADLRLCGNIECIKLTY